MFSDEVHFWLSGCVNEQNCCIWSDKNPLEIGYHRKSHCLVCILVRRNRLSVFFQRGHTHGDRYRAVITIFLFLA